MNRRTELWLVTCFLLLAAVLRIWDLTRLPPGFSDNELAYLRMTETIRQQEVAVYYQIGDGHARTAMYAIGNELVTTGVGDGLLGYRLFPLWIGLTGLALLYVLARRLFGVPVALIALGIMALNLRAILLSRTASAEAMVPGYELLVLLTLVVAFNLRREIRFHTPATAPFALLAVLLGGSGYLHYTLLILAPLSVIFFFHLIYTHQPLSRRMWSAWVFVIVLATIVAMPFLISTLRNPRLSEIHILASDRPRSVTDAVEGLLQAVSGVIWQGDARADQNLPSLALVGPVTALLLIIGTLEAVRRWREPRYALILLVLAAGVLTDAWIEPKTTFSADLVALPAVYILPGIGVLALWRMLRGRGVPQAWQPVAVGLVLILIANVIASWHHLFSDWQHSAKMKAAYHSNLGYLAAYLDRTPDGLPVSLCAVHMNEPTDAGLTPRQILRMMMSRETLKIRHSDCRGGLVLINAGAPMRFAFADLKDRAEMPPELADWIKDASVIPVEGLPDGSVLRLDVEQRVRDSGGYWGTYSPTFFMPDESSTHSQVTLPVPLAHNLTFAGYDPRALNTDRVAGGEPIVLVTYWRVDGPLPDHLGIFAHLLAYPQTGSPVPLLEPWAEANSIDVIPSELKNRDFFAQVSYIWLSENVEPGLYAVTVGAYTGEVSVLANHLNVLDSATNYGPHGERLLLGDVTVKAAEKPAGGGS